MPATEGQLTHDVIGAAIEVHKVLGPGLLESAYEAALCREFELRGLRCQCQLSLPVVYKELKLDVGYRIDFLIEDELILEVKAVEKVLGVHKAQLLTYMKLLQKPLGLLVNFHVPVLKDGITRLILQKINSPQ